MNSASYRERLCEVLLAVVVLIARSSILLASHRIDSTIKYCSSIASINYSGGSGEWRVHSNKLETRDIMNSSH
jgi:hypothetical protein